MGRVLLVVSLSGLLVAAIWLAVQLWNSVDGEISTNGFIALGLGVVGSLVVGCGLMALVFISSRRGCDDQVRSEDLDDEAP